MEFKTIEGFTNEVRNTQERDDCTLLEALSSYMEKYELDEEYMIKHLLSKTPGLVQDLKEESKKFNLIKTVKPSFDDI